MFDNNHEPTIGELTIDELDAVSGGIKGAIEGVCRKDETGQSGKPDPLGELFRQVMSQHT